MNMLLLKKFAIIGFAAWLLVVFVLYFQQYESLINLILVRIFK